MTAHRDRAVGRDYVAMSSSSGPKHRSSDRPARGFRMLWARRAARSSSERTAPVHATNQLDLHDSGTGSRAGLLTRMVRRLRSDPVAAIAAAAAVAAVLTPLGIAAYDRYVEPAVEVQSSPIDFRTGQWTAPDLVIPKPIGEIDRPPLSLQDNSRQFSNWVKRHDGVYANLMSVSFIARTGHTQPIVILGLRVRVTDRKPPLEGSWIKPNGAGPGPDRVLFVDLDQEPPATTIDGGWTFPLEITSTDIEGFTVEARTAECHCFWEIELHYLDTQGSERTDLVNQDGKPFELTATTNTKDAVTLPSTEDDPWPT